MSKFTNIAHQNENSLFLSKRLLADTDFTLTDKLIYATILVSEDEALTLDQIASALGVNKKTVSLNLNKLEKAGKLSRTTGYKKPNTYNVNNWFGE